MKFGKTESAIVIGLLAIFLVGGALFYFASFASIVSPPKEKVNPASPNPSTICGFDYCYNGKEMKYTLNFNSKGSVQNPTCYVYKDKPAGWDNGRSAIDTNYLKSGTASSGAYTIQQEPGTYYTRCVLSGYYTDFRSVTIPIGSDSTATDYNSAPDSKSVELYPQDTASTSNLDFGITTNATTSAINVKAETVTVATNKSYILDDMKMTASSTYKFNLDDGTATSHKGAAVAADSVYNEGISKIEFDISGGDLSGTDIWIPFDTTTSTNDFGSTAGGIASHTSFSGANTITAQESNTITINTKLTTTCRSDTTLASDECWGNGENIGTVTLIDQLGTAATFTLTA